MAEISDDDMQQWLQQQGNSQQQSPDSDEEPVSALAASTPTEISDEDMQQALKAGEAKPSNELSDEEMQQALQSGKARPASTLKSNAAGAFARNAIEGVAPAVGALPAIGPGFAAGAAVGGAVAGPPGAMVGGFMGALGAGLGAGYLVSQGQDWVMDQLGLREGTGYFSREQAQADIEQHPYWSTLGGVSAGVVPFGGAPTAIGRAMTSAEKLAARKAALMSSGVFAGLEASSELYHEGAVDPGRVAIAGAGGYLLSHPRKFASDIISKTTEASGLAKYSDKYFAGRPGVPITDVDAVLKDAVDSSSGTSPPATSDNRGTASERSFPDKAETQGDAVPGVGNAGQGPGVTDGRPDYRKPAGEQRANNGVNVGSVFADIANQLKGAANAVDTEHPPVLNQQPTEAAASEAERYRGSHIETQVRAMAEQGKTATEISNFTGVPPNVVRFLRGDLKPGSETELPAHSKAATEGPPLTPNERRGGYGSSEVNPPPVEDMGAYQAELAPPEPPARTAAIEASKAKATAAPVPEQQLKKGIPGVGVGQEKPARPAAVPSTPAAPQALELGKGIPGVKTAPATDRAYRKVTQDVLKQLDAKDTPEFKAVAKAIREATSSASRDQLAMRAQAVLQGKETKTGAYEQVRTRKDLVLPNGEKAANEKDFRRKQNSLDARNKVYNDERYKALPVEYGDTSKEARAKLADWAQQVTKDAIEAGGGTHPVDTYKHRDAPYRWLDAVRKLMSKGGTSPKRLQDFYTTVKQLREGGEEGLKAVKAERSAEAERELRRAPAVEEVSETIEQPRTTERQEFETLPEWKPGADESKQYIDSSNELRTWINSLSPEDYGKLEGQHPNLAHDVNLTQDPEYLLDVYKTGLENAPTRAAKPIPTEVGKKAGAPLEEKFGKASEGRVLDKSSPEFKAIAERAAAEANKRVKDEGILPPAKQPKAPVEREARSSEAETAEETINRYNAEKDPAKANSDIIGTMKNMLDDESGKVMLPPKVVEVLTRKPSEQYHARTLSTPEAVAAGSISDDLHTMDQSTVNDLVKHQKDMRVQPEEFKDGKVQEDLYLARERGDIDSQPEAVRNWYESYLRPIFDENNTLYQWAQKLNPKLLEDLNLNHVHRLMQGRSLIDWVNDPVSGSKRSLFTMVGPLMDRQFKAIQEKGSDRRGVISAEKDQSGFTLWDRGEALHVPVSEFDFKNGFEFKIGNRDYVVTEALTPEIEAHARDSEGNMVKYYKNAALSAVIANVKLKEATRHMLYLHSLENSAEWGKFAQRSKPDSHDPVKGGWEQPILTQFKDWWMDPKLAAVFNDYAQPGFGGNKTLDWFRDLSRSVTKLMFWLPTPHILNVGAHWYVARDWRWLQPMAYKDLAVTGVDAIKSVVEQDDFQKQMRHLGAGTLSGGIMTTDFPRNVAREFGMQIKREPTKWDPVVKTLGMEGVRELTDAIYKGSSRVMWAANDMFLTQLVKENMKRGMDMKEAIITAERHIPNYRVPTEIFGSRAMSQFMQDPLVSAFGRYRYGVFNSYAHIVKGLVNGTGEQRIEAIGNLMAMGMLAFMVYPVLNKWAAWLTGNKEAEQRPRGPLAIPTHLFRAAVSKNKPEGWATSAKATLTMPPLPAALLEAYNNKDWAGRDVMQEGRIRGVRDLARRGVQAGEHMARSLISPLGSAENAIGRKEPIGDALRDMLLDIKNPSRKAIAYEHKLERRNIQQATRRSIHPPNQGEALFNWLFGKRP